MADDRENNLDRESVRVRLQQRGLTHDFGDAMAAKRKVAQRPKRRKSKADAVALDRTPFILMASGSLRL